MSLDIVAAIEDGFSRSVTESAAILAGAFLAAGLAMSAVMNSLMVTLLTETVDLREVFAESPEITYDEFVQQIQSSAPLDVIDAPAGALVGLVILAWLVNTIVQIGAIRWFVEERSGGLHGALFTRRLLWTIGNLVVGGILFFAAVFVAPLLVVGLVAVFSPILAILALIVAIVVMVFLSVALYFYNFHIVVDGSNAIEALAESWTLTEGNRIMLFLLGFVVVLAGTIVGGVVGFVTGTSILLSTAVTQVINAVVAVVTIAIAAAAFNQLRGVGDDAGGETGDFGAASADEL